MTDKQPTIDELFDKFENKESNKETYKYKEDEPTSDNIKMTNIEKIPCDSNGIVEVRYGNEVYRTWKVEFIRPLTIKFLKGKYPESIVIRELNNIDITIIDKKTDEIIPIEIQKTPLIHARFNHSEFEKEIRKGIEDNIENYDICWFFMDSEYLRYLQSENVGKGTSVNLTWVIDLMRGCKLKVFTIKYDGTVKELTTKDFDFLKNISQTCSIGENSDERILNRNKLKIFKNVIIECNFNQKEIDNFYLNFNNRISNEKDAISFFKKSNNDRCKLYGYILMSIGNLPSINIIMDMNGFDNATKRNLVYLRIFDVVGTCGHGNVVRFVDKFDICKYFPGYLRNKKQWDSYKNLNVNLTHETLVGISSGNYKKNFNMNDY